MGVIHLLRGERGERRAEDGSALGVTSFARRSNRDHRPAIALVAKRDVEIARFRLPTHLHAPLRADVVLPLGTLLTRAEQIEAARLHAIEETVEKIRSLIASVEIVSALVGETRKLQHHPI